MEANGGIRLRTVVLDCRDARAMADFYGKLLGWGITAAELNWILMRDPAGGTGLSFQEEERYVEPVWPEQEGAPMKMIHLDFLVDDLEKASSHALACGARLAKEQYFAGVRVFLDPAGHPFCLFVAG